MGQTRVQLPLGVGSPADPERLRVPGTFSAPRPPASGQGEGEPLGAGVGVAGLPLRGALGPPPGLGAPHGDVVVCPQPA